MKFVSNKSIYNMQPYDLRRKELIEEFQTTKTRRFWGYIIDACCYYTIAIIFFTIVIAIHPLYEDIIEKSIIHRFFTFSICLIYFIGFEYFTQRSIGKYLLKLKVVNLDGSKPTMQTLLKRNASRIFGWEALFYLFGKHLWHDKWSDTLVVEEEKLNQLEELNSIGDRNSEE